MDVSLRVPAGTDAHRAHQLAEKSEQVCLVTRSLTGRKILNVAVIHDS
jgi:organic hydroperoxide reductase OsmC/OhrA